MEKRYFLSLLGLVMFLHGTRATTFHVSVTGSDLASGHSPAQAFATLQHAVSQAAGGDTVLVYDGDHAGFQLSGLHSTAMAPFVVRAVGNAAEIVLPAPGGDGNGVELLGCSYVLIEGIGFRGLPKYGLYSVSSKGISVHRGRFMLNAVGGVRLDDGMEAKIIGNDLRENGVGILCSGASHGVVIEANTVEKSVAQGLLLEGGITPLQSPRIRRNRLYGNGDPLVASIELNGVTDGLLANNMVREGSGLALLITGDENDPSKSNRVYNNTLLVGAGAPWAVGLTDGCQNSMLVNNIIAGSGPQSGSVNMGERTHGGTYSEHNIFYGTISKDGGLHSGGLSTWQTASTNAHSLEVAQIATLFRDLVNGDLSSADVDAAQVNAGSSSVLAHLGSDIDLMPRPQSFAVDIGAHERASGMGVAAGELPRGLEVRYLDGQLVVPQAQIGDRFVVYDATGRRVARFTATDTTVRQPFSKPSGVYIVDAVTRLEGRSVGRFVVP